MDHSTPGSPVFQGVWTKFLKFILPNFLKFAQIHVHWVSEAVTILFSATPFSFCFHSFTASGSFPVSQLFASGGQSTGAAASASVLPMNTQGWFLFGWTSFISLLSKDSQESSPTPQFKSIHSWVLSLLYGPTLISIHDYWKNHSFDCMHLCWQSDIFAF